VLADSQTTDWNPLGFLISEWLLRHNLRGAGVSVRELGANWCWTPAYGMSGLCRPRSQV